MLPLAMNMKQEKKNGDNGWICSGCKGLPPPPTSDASPDPAEDPHPPQSQVPALETLLKTLLK